MPEGVQDVDSQKVQGLIGEILLTLGVDYHVDENFKETPRRLAGVLREFLQSETSIRLQVAKLAEAVFPSKQDELVVIGNIRVFSLCPHHCLPVGYRVSLGYIPSGFVIGLSKLPRLVKAWSRVSLLQEDYTVKLKESMVSMLRTKNVGVIVEGRHLCMEVRGVEMRQIWTTTSSLSGSFLEPGVKREFMELGQVGRPEW